MSAEDGKFYVAIRKHSGMLREFKVAPSEREVLFEPNSKKTSTPPRQAPHPSQLDFESVMKEYSRGMEMYINFVPLLMSFGPLIWSSVASMEVEKYADANGSKRDDLIQQNTTVYELDIKHYEDFRRRASEVFAITQGSKDITKIMIIGLISTYDFYLSQLLRVVYTAEPKIVFNSTKQISYDDLIKHESIDAVRDAIIEKEVESIIRESHQEQFRLLETKFGMKLTAGLSVWPRFIEICERRNLFTHTGGVVSQQYLDKCREGKCEIGSTSLGQVLSVEPSYFRKAVRVVHEVGLKLGYVLWRKFTKDHAGRPDFYINQVCFDLIGEKQYEVAEAVLELSISEVEKRRGKELYRKMMVVNLANALKLQNKQPRANAVLDKEDWSASDDQFQISVAAVRGDVDTVVSLMRRVGNSEKMPSENYTEWPVFASVRKDERFLNAYEEVFAEKFKEKDKKLSLGRSLDSIMEPEDTKDSMKGTSVVLSNPGPDPHDR